MTCICTFTTIAEAVNVKIEAKIEALIAEKLSYITQKVDALGGGIANVVRVVDGLAAFVDANAPTLDARLRQAESSVEDEPLAPEPLAPVPVPVDNLAHILDEMRIQQRETRDYIGLWAMFVMLFIAMLYMVHTPPPVGVSSPVCAPITECATVIPSKWDAMTTCARIMFTNEEYLMTLCSVFLINSLRHKYTSIGIKDCVSLYIHRVSTMSSQVVKAPPALKRGQHVCKCPELTTAEVYDLMASQEATHTYFVCNMVRLAGV